MSFLAPLYVLGVLGISLPILFHLIRRQPRGQWRFSSLMFLRPTPPTLTRRSRLENLPLLLLRALALLMLAAAFARPFLRSPLIEPDAAPGKRIVMVIDTSASMQRSGLWAQANQLASDLLMNLKPTDHVAVISFDSQPTVAMSFEQSTSLDLDARREAATQAIKQLKPTWAATELGSALILAADLLATTETDAPMNAEDGALFDASSASLATHPGHIVVISDMQIGSERNLKNLQAYSWPKEIKTEIRSVVADRKTNAVAGVLRPRDGDEASQPASTADAPENQHKTRVRVSNSAESSKADFSIVWATAAGQPIDVTRLPVHLAPGESRVIRMIEPPPSVADTTAMRLVMTGDDHDFDNVRYVARPAAIEQQLLFIGSTTEEPRNSLLYYLQRAPLLNRRRNVTVVTAPAAAVPEAIDARKTPLVVVGDVIAEPAIASLKRYTESGGKVLWVLGQNKELAGLQHALALLLESPDLAIAEASVKDYSMLSKIDFSYPLFKPLADARYNDFTKIRFWSHRKLTGLPATCKLVANFDDGDPAIIAQPIGAGQSWIITAGWQPTQSQLALSTKFVPLLDGFFSYGDRSTTDIEQVVMGSEPPFEPSATARIERTGQAAIEYRTRDDFVAVDQPGLYRFVDGELNLPFAVNVAESESVTQPMASDELERFGVVLGTIADSVPALATQRQQRDVELESRQRLWQWILVAVLCLLAAESWLSGYLDRKQARSLAPT